MNTTWKCDICKKERPDDKIGVHSTDISLKYDLPVGVMQHNVKYCLDDPHCVGEARVFSHERNKE
jgi:hypothetical protein